jgi:hypothetical protein
MTNYYENLGIIAGVMTGLVLGSLGLLISHDFAIDNLVKENKTLRTNMSNLVERVEYYQGTNWNYTSSLNRANKVKR